MHMDAIEMLKTQHAEVEALFAKLGHTSDEGDWRGLVGRQFRGTKHPRVAAATTTKSTPMTNERTLWLDEDLGVPRR